MPKSPMTVALPMFYFFYLNQIDCISTHVTALPKCLLSNGGFKNSDSHCLPFEDTLVLGFQTVPMSCNALDMAFQMLEVISKSICSTPLTVLTGEKHKFPILPSNSVSHQDVSAHVTVSCASYYYGESLSGTGFH